MFLHRNKQGQHDTLKQDRLKHTKHSESAFPNNPYFLQISGTMVTPSSITRYEYTFGDNGPIKETLYFKTTIDNTLKEKITQY